MLLLILSLVTFYACSDEDTETDDPIPTDTQLIAQAMFNSGSLQSFEIISSTLEDGSTDDCYRIVFSSNPVESGPFCPRTIDEVAGLGVYDGATNPGLRVFAEALLNDIEADGYDMVNEDGTVNVFDFTSGQPNADVSNCLEAATDDNLFLTFLIPVNPKLSGTNNVIEEVELVGLSLDGVGINGDPPSATAGPRQGGPGGGVATEINFPSLDPCGGHHDPAGYYHWHFIPEVMNQVLAAQDITEVSCTKMDQVSNVALVGFAKDGFPIYAYADMPTDIDDCNGRTASTTEYPNGIYHYVASTTSAPNIPPCLKGVAARNSFSYQ